MDLPKFLNYIYNLEREHRLDSDKSNNNNEMKKVQLDQTLFMLNDEYFCSCFGLPKTIVQGLLEELHRSTFYCPENDPHASLAIPFDIRVLATLSFLVHGHLEHFMSLPYESLRRYRKIALMRCVTYACETIVLFLTPLYVRFPHKQEEVCINKMTFQQKFGLPGVLGVLDCFFVRLQNIPEDQRRLYINRHGHTALNVQVICDQNYRFLDVNARFSGITGDNYIWNRSHIQEIVRKLYVKDKKTWLVADRGYRLNSFIMNPYRNALTAEQKSLNVTLTNMCGVLDRAVAILKARFGCLRTELPFNHQQSTNIITACVTLHNYLLAKRYPIEENIICSFPKKSELPNAKYEDMSREGNANRKYLADLQYHNFWRSLKHINLQPTNAS